jgi:sigma-B regulation protein RsbU (phosphoserine phosphatase)
MFKILIIDDDPIIRAALRKTLQNQGYDTTIASNGEEGIKQAILIHPALIICDWMMANLDGLEVCRRIKSQPELATTFFILLTAKGEVEERVEGLDAGADEFLSKPLEMNELKARVRAGLRIHQLNQDLQVQKQALEALNQNLHSELAEAADYVRSLLPAPLIGSINTQTLFVPSAQLGGDCFDYYWLDDDYLAIYLLDVSGHGVGSALLSVSVLNVLRSQSLPKTNFYQPDEVLKALNTAFQMVNHSDKYFTIWYGVYNRQQRQLTYANAGHPPALLINKDPSNIEQLEPTGLPIGFLPDADFDCNTCKIGKNSTLFIFSDGAYEIQQLDDTIWGLSALNDLLQDFTKSNSHLENLLQQIIARSNKNTLDDDLSLLKLEFD